MDGHRVHRIEDPPLRSASPLLRYVLALAITAIAVVLQRIMHPLLPPSLHLFFYPAVVLSAWMGGFGPGAVSVAGSMLALAYLLRLPMYSLGQGPTRDALDLAIFGGVTLGLAYLTARTRQASRSAVVALDRAEEATAAKDQLLSIVSHDLKNPLHTIALSVDLIEALMSQGDFASIGKHTARVRRASERASRLVADLIDASKLESGTLKLHTSDWLVDSLIADAVSPFVPIAKARGIRLDMSIGTKGSIICDRERVLQVLTDLVGSAMQNVAPHGEVHVSCDKTDREFRLSVSDSGPGMTPEQLEHAFQPYWPARTDAPGSGFSLFISREIVKAHGGQLEIVSEKLRGTVVRIVLPQATSIADEPQEAYFRQLHQPDTPATASKAKNETA